MTSKQTSSISTSQSSHNNDPGFWQQLDRDFPFKGVDEEQLRLQTEQWVTCASELLGPPPSRAKKAIKR